jgi:hypothetical protein
MTAMAATKGRPVGGQAPCARRTGAVPTAVDDRDHSTGTAYRQPASTCDVNRRSCPARPSQVDKKEASQVALRGSFSAIGISLWDDTYGRKPLRRSQHSSAYRVPSFQKILETQRRRWTREALVRKAEIALPSPRPS